MSNIFSDLASMGFEGLSNLKIFDDEEEKKKEKKVEAKPEPVQVKEEDFLFEKTLKCPVCDKEFKEKTVKTGKPRLIGSDPDLRPKYQGIDSVKYDAVICPRCGYGALSRFFAGITAHQAKTIKDNVSANFKGLPGDGTATTYSYDDALARFKLVLFNTVVKKGKISERAYTCLKIAWLYRGKAENLNPEDKDYTESKNACEEAEKEFLKNAYEGFTMALSKELYPICGMDEFTFMYLMANLAYMVGQNDESLRYVSRIIISPGANPKLKDKARDLKELLKK